MSTTLLESNLGVMVGPGILCPTIKAFFFSPLIARRILSPTLPTPVLLYTWIHFGGRWYGVFPKALLSTTRTRVSFCIAWRAPVILKCRWITVLLRWVKDKPNRLFKRAMWILVILPTSLIPAAQLHTDSETKKHAERHMCRSHTGQTARGGLNVPCPPGQD